MTAKGGFEREMGGGECGEREKGYRADGVGVAMCSGGVMKIKLF